MVATTLENHAPHNIISIAGYRFTTLTNLNKLRCDLQKQANQLNLKGTILLSSEGINISLAGFKTDIASFRAFLDQEQNLANMRFHLTQAEAIPFKKLKVKIKKEIITINQPQIDYTATRAPAISPSEFKKWLDEKRDITILDTRNNYEVEVGTFENAISLNINHFTHLLPAVQQIHLNKEKTVVMFCTGGIRCEKAALCLIEQGFTNVYQLDGGILNYFAEVGTKHYQGDCFIFDDRIALNASAIAV